MSDERNCILPSFLHRISSSGSESDQRIMETQRYRRIYEAFRLLQTDSNVQVGFSTLEGFLSWCMIVFGFELASGFLLKLGDR